MGAHLCSWMSAELLMSTVIAHGHVVRVCKSQQHVSMKMDECSHVVTYQTNLLGGMCSVFVPARHEERGHIRLGQQHDQGPYRELGGDWRDWREFSARMNAPGDGAAVSGHPLCNLPWAFLRYQSTEQIHTTLLVHTL